LVEKLATSRATAIWIPWFINFYDGASRLILLY
jgi:hypothetical protein